MCDFPQSVLLNYNTLRIGVISLQSFKMGQLNAPPNNPPLPPVPAKSQFQFPYIQRVKETPFMKGLLYSYQPSIYVESVGIKLSTILNPRLNTKGHFPQPQIIKLIKGVIEALAFLESRSIRYGDITVDNIYYDKVFKGFKLIHPHLVPETSYHITKAGKRFSLLSPEYLLCLSQNQEQIQESMIFKADLFTFGLILLQVCTLKVSSQVYDEDTYNILHPKIVERMNSVKKYYTQGVFKIVHALLQYDMNTRKNAREIKVMLDEYQRNNQSSSQVNIQGPVQGQMQPQNQPPPQQMVMVAPNQGGYQQ